MMKEKTICFQIKEIVEREEDKEIIIFDYNETTKKWVYHAPSAQNHTEEQIEVILNKLRELNKSEQ